jgi:TetR/AcrR family transcriptional regulator
VEHSQNTEEHIKTVAQKLFIEKGFAGTTIRDIACEAETNMALVNYYFRSKDKLFEKIMMETLQSFFAVLFELINKDVPLQEKIEWLIEEEFKFLKNNPDLPLFIANEMKMNKSSLFNQINIQEKIKTSLFTKQVDIAVTNGDIQPISATELMFFVLSNIQYVFISKEVIKKISDYNETEFEAYINRHKKRVKEFIIHYIFVKK